MCYLLSYLWVVCGLLVGCIVTFLGWVRMVALMFVSCFVLVMC